MIALLSDLHGNLPALEAVLADMPPVRAIWVLGDLIGELGYPCETLDALIALGERVPVVYVAGNRELSMLALRRGEHPDWQQGTQLRALAWTADQLTQRHWDFLAAMPTTQRVCSPAANALLFHGSPAHVRGLIKTQAEAQAAARPVAEAWLIGGHTHHARHFAVDNGAYVNAGSVGISLDGIGRAACYGLLNEERSTQGTPHVQFRYLPYDTQALIDRQTAVGLSSLAPGISYATLQEVLTGRRYVQHLIDFVRKYAEKELGSAPAAIPPDLWMKAEARWLENTRKTNAPF